MKTLWGDKSDLLFRRLLFYTLLAYSLLALIIEMTPYTPEVIKRGKKENRTVTLIEISSKRPPSLSSHIKEREKRLAEEKKREELEKRLAEEQRRLEEERKKAEEKKRMEEERRLAEEKRRLEEEERLKKERNREVAMSAGLLKAMRGEKRAADRIVSNAEIKHALSTPSEKLIAVPEGKTEGAVSKDQTTSRKIIKGSGGIGDISRSLAKEELSGLSGQKIRGGIQTSSIKGELAPPHFSQGPSRERSQASIREVVNSHRGSLDFIYKKALRDNPLLKGTILIELTIAANGDVIDGHVVSSTMKDPTFEDQVLRRILTWKFPPYPDIGNTVVSFPIEFSPA